MKDKVKILVAEDQVPYALILENDLSVLGVEIELVGDGYEAVQKIKEDKSFGAIIMDIHMPRMDGYEATQKIRELQYQNPIIGFSSFHSDEHVRKGIEVGMNAYLAKQADISVLTSLLNDLKVISHSN